MAMRTIAVVNLKGGVAKSTTVINMAAILARHYGKKVCIIDADSQCNTTEFFGADPGKGNLADVLRDSAAQAHPGVDAAFNIQATKHTGIDILAGDGRSEPMHSTRMLTASFLAGCVCRNLLRRSDDG